MVDYLFISFIGYPLSGILALILLFSNKPMLRYIELLISSFTSLCVIIFTLPIIITNPKPGLESPSYDIIASLIQFQLYVDRLSAIFLLLVAIVSLCVFIYSMNFLDQYTSAPKGNLLVSLMNFFVLALILVVCSQNLFIFLFFWETMALLSYFLVIFDNHKTETQRSANFYFILTQISTVFIFFGFLALYQFSGSFNIRSSLKANMNTFDITVILITLFLGFGIKAGIMPFHKWMPYAYSASPSNTSALLAGLMSKVAIYGFIRFFIYIFYPIDISWGLLLLGLGSLSVSLGIIYALKESYIKHLLAYSSVENIGVILSGLGLYIIFINQYIIAPSNNSVMLTLALLSLAGAIFHAFNHGIMKSLLFLSAGSVIQTTGSDNLEEYGGVIKKMPVTAITFLIGALSISALPPFNGFSSEFMILIVIFRAIGSLNHFLQAYLAISLALLGLGSGLASSTFVKAFMSTFLAIPRSSKAEHAHEVPNTMLIGQSILALLCIFLGLISSQLFSFLGYDFQLPDLFLLGILFLILTVLTIIFLNSYASKETRVTGTWGCGFPTHTFIMEYSPSGFSEPVERVFKNVYRTKIMDKNHLVYMDSQKSVVKEGKANIQLMKIFEEYLYLPIARLVDKMAGKVARLQNDNSNTYILYVFLGVVMIILLLGLGGIYQW